MADHEIHKVEVIFVKEELQTFMADSLDTLVANIQAASEQEGIVDAFCVNACCDEAMEAGDFL